MTKLSPSAQAVMVAVASSMEGGWISPEFIPYEAHKAAAALRAAVKQLATYAGVQDGYQRHLIDADEILSIAAELEAQ